MRAFFHPQQDAYRPVQSMRLGRIVAAKDVPQRTAALLGALARLGLVVERPEDLGLDPVLQVHTADYLNFLSTIWPIWCELPGHGPEVWPNYAPCVSGRDDQLHRGPCPTQSIAGQVGWYVGDLSAPVGPYTWLSARHSASTAVAAADAVLGTGGPAYALCRPSGHHARADRAAGACYLNNVAIAAQRLRTRFARVAILDVDVHHGDGTQHIFYGRDDVLTVSIHADPVSAYPFYTGHAHERGHGPGTGFNLNLPIEPGTGAAAFLAALERAAAAIEAFGPEALVIALGFDGHGRDPVQLLTLDSADYAHVGRLARALRVPVLFVQEGGYAVDALADCLAATLGPWVGAAGSP